MNQYSALSETRLASCHPKIQKVFRKVLEDHDHTIICGERGREEQEDAVRQGKSEKHYPYSEHNKTPSRAVDASPYPVNWKDESRFYYFAGIVLATARSMGINLIWGGDWDRDNDFSDQNFHDLVHFQLAPEEL